MWQAAAPYEVLLHKKHNLKAAADSILQVAAAIAAALQRPLAIIRIRTARSERLLPSYGELHILSSLPTSPRRAIRFKHARHPVSLDAWQPDRGDLPSPVFLYCCYIVTAADVDTRVG